MNKNYQLLAALGVLILTTFVFWGSRNQIDPEWEAIKQGLDDDFFTVAMAEDSLVALLNKINQMECPRSILLDRFYTPFVPILEYEEFASIVRTIAQEKRAVLSGVNGAGASTIANRVSRFIATDSSNILRVVGVPKFDMHLHYKYIGKEESGRFVRGELFDFFDQCRAKPTENFVCVFDDLEKIEPETFFGAEFWYKLYEPTERVMLGGKPIEIPSNLYMLSTAHAKPSAQAVITDLHYQRLGEKIDIQPNTNTMILYLQNMMRERGESVAENENILPFVYTFQRANQIVAEKYGLTYTMGQWSPLRKMYHRDEYEDVIQHLLFHVNSFNPRQ